MSIGLVEKSFSFAQRSQMDPSWTGTIKYEIGARLISLAAAILVSAEIISRIALMILSASFTKNRQEQIGVLLPLASACLIGIYSPKLIEQKLLLSPLQAEIREHRLRVGSDVVQRKLQKEWEYSQNAMKNERDSGLFIPYQDPDIESDDEEEPQWIGPYQVGVCHFLGKRPSMEDEHVAESFDLRLKNQVYPAQLFGIFDGHGGKEAAEFLKSHLKKELEKTLFEFNSEGLTDVGIWNALKLTFVRLNEKFQGRSGSTAIVSLILDGKMWTANAGDSRAILENHGEIQQLSVDAKPSDKRFEKGILNRGGYVESSRVNGRISTARALGDHFLGKAMSARPKITVTQIPQKGHLILVCDGVHNVASTRQIGGAVCDNPGSSPLQIAQNLVYSASEANSKDNISALVVKFTQTV